MRPNLARPGQGFYARSSIFKTKFICFLVVFRKNVKRWMAGEIQPTPLADGQRRCSNTAQMLRNKPKKLNIRNS